MKRALHIAIHHLRTIKHGVRAYWFLALDALFVRSAVRLRRDGKKRVIVIRLDRIGDFVLWLDAAQHLRRLYPRDTHDIVLLGNSLWTPLAEGTGFFDEVWPLDRSRFTSSVAYRVGILRKVRAAGFDVVVQPTYSREFIFGDAIVRWSDASVRIGSEGDFSNMRPWQKRISDRWYTKLVPATDAYIMELVRNAEFVRGIGLHDVRAAVPRLLVTSSGCTTLSGDYVILFPGASEPIKQWPLDNFLIIARKLHQSTRMQIVLCGGAEDSSLGAIMEAHLEFPIVNRIGKTSLSELAGIVAGARILVGNDTSAIHIAAAVSTPSLCIVGGGHFGRFVPYLVETGRIDVLPAVVTCRMECFGCNWKCIYPLPKDYAAPCIADVTVEAVWQALQPLILAPRIVTNGKKDGHFRGPNRS